MENKHKKGNIQNNSAFFIIFSLEIMLRIKILLGISELYSNFTHKSIFLVSHLIY